MEAILSAFASTQSSASFFNPLSAANQRLHHAPPPNPIDPWTGQAATSYAVDYSFPPNSHAIVSTHAANMVYPPSHNSASNAASPSSYADDDGDEDYEPSHHGGDSRHAHMGVRPEDLTPQATYGSDALMYHSAAPTPTASTSVSSTRKAPGGATNPDGTPKKKPVTRRNPEKRKEQNRAAQRAFRDRKERRLVELESRTTKLEELIREQAAANSHLSSMVHALRTDNARLRATVTGQHEGAQGEEQQAPQQYHHHPPAPHHPHPSQQLNGGAPAAWEAHHQLSR